MGRVRATILIVEDDPSVRRVVTLLLELEGHRVTAHEDVRSALDFAEDHPGGIDLLVADIRVPGGNAPALVAGLAALGHEPPILYMSGYGKPDTPLPGAESLYLTKPFVPVQLIEAVERLLGR